MTPVAFQVTCVVLIALGLISLGLFLDYIERIR